MSTARSVARALLAAVGVALVAFGVFVGVSVWGSEAFPAGLALGLALVAFAAGVAALGAAALLSGESLRPIQRAALKLAGALAVAAFVLPAAGVFAIPELLYEWFGRPGFAVAIAAWFYLTAAAVVVGAAVAAWRALELAYALVTD